jgi:hypothetical protein
MAGNSPDVISSAEVPTKIEALRSEARTLLSEALTFFRSRPLEQACAAFASPAWRRGPLTMFVLDGNGIVYVDNDHKGYLWNQFPWAKDFYGQPLLTVMLSVGEAGGWVAFPTRNSVHHALVKRVLRDGKVYVLGVGFFSDVPYLLSQLLADSVASYWSKLGIYKTIELINNTHGPLVRSEITVIVMDTTGVCWAHGSNILMVGQNLTGQGADAAGFRDILKAFQSMDDQAALWVDIRKKAGTQPIVRRLYCKRIFDQRLRKDFIIMSGYYEGITPTTVEALAEHVAQVLTAVHAKVPQDKAALSPAVFECLAKAEPIGDLTVMILDAQATVLFYSSPAQGAAFVGRSMLNYVDEQRRAYYHRLMHQLKDIPAVWVTRFNKHALERLYGKKVQTMHGEYVIVIFGYYATTDREIVQALVSDAHYYLKEHPCLCAFRAFADESGSFVKGDKHIFVYDNQGICWADGLHPASVWHKDPMFARLTEGWVYDKRSENQRELYIARLTKKVEFDGKEIPFIIGSGYYIII